MRYVISVDAGKHGTKCVGRRLSDQQDKEVYFPTRYYDLNNGDMELQGNSYRVDYFEDTSYIIGEQGEFYDTSTTKTSFLHKLAIYTAITQIVGEDRKPSIVLTIGCPTAIFKNPNLKEEYREYIADSSPIEIRVNDKEYSLILEKVIIKCEGSGITYLEPMTFKNERVAVLDLGGRNMNFGIYDNRVSIPSSLFSNNYGGTFLESMVREELSIYYGDDFDLETAARAIKQGGIMINGHLEPDSALLVGDTIDWYVNNYILNSIKEKNINLSIMPVVAIGGTSHIIIDHLKKKIPHVRLSNIDSLWANVKGFQLVGLVKAGMV